MGIINVTCAIIQKGGYTLAVQRSEKMKMALKWEFPGGKIEENESEENSIIREIKEELGINIKLIAKLNPSVFHYPKFSINLIPFLADYSSGELRLLEHKQHLWLTKDRLLSLDWAEADIPILNDYLNL